MSTIMVVDDDQMSRELITASLRNYKYDLIEAHDGAEALEKVAKQPQPDLIITDIKMPKLNGIQFVKALSKDAILCQIPIIFYTSEEYVVDATLISMGCGIPTVLIKPCDPQLIIDAVQRVLTLKTKLPEKGPEELVLYSSDIEHIHNALQQLKKHTQALVAEQEQMGVMLKLLFKPGKKKKEPV